VQALLLHGTFTPNMTCFGTTDADATRRCRSVRHIQQKVNMWEVGPLTCITTMAIIHGYGTTGVRGCVDV
jgi:hypothetical protein